MEVIKQCVNLGKTVFDGQIKAGCNGSIIVPDIKPDIIKVLQVDADTFLCEKTVENGKVTLSGKVNVTVLYIPEDEESCVCAIKGCFEFCEVIKKPEFDQGMQILAVCDAEKVSYKLINSRKIGVEATITINVQVIEESSFEVVQNIDGDDAQCRYECINVTSPGVYKEHCFGIEESFSISGAKPQIKEILKGNVMILDKEYKALADRVIVKGNGMLSCLYLGENSEIEHFQKEMPFTEVVDMLGVYEDADCDISFEVGELKLDCEKNGDGESVVSVGYDVTCAIKTEQEQSVTAVSDCYFPDAEEVLEYIDVCADEIVARPKFSTVIKEMIKTDDKMPEISGIYSAVAKPYIDSVKLQGNKICVSGKIIVYVLYTTDSIQVPVCSLNEEIPFSYAIDCDGLTEDANILLKSECEHISSVICSNNTVEVRCGILIQGRVAKKKNVRMIADAKKGEVICKECGILIYFAKSGDSVWDVGKKYRVPQKCICDSMQGKDEICEGMKLIIPVSKQK